MHALDFILTILILLAFGAGGVRIYLNTRL